MTIYNSSQIVNENVNIIKQSLPDEFHSGAFISVGGTTKPAGTVIDGITNQTYTDILKDGIGIASITQLYKKPTTFTVVDTNAVNSGNSFLSLDSISEAIQTMSWSGGTVSVTTASADLVNGKTFDVLIAGVVPEDYNGIKSITVSTAGDFSFESANFGTVTTQGTVQFVKGVLNDPPTTLPFDTPFYAYVSNTASAIMGERKITVFSTGVFFYPCAVFAGTISIADARFRVVKATITAHGLPQDKAIRVSVSGVIGPNFVFNGVKNATASDANTIFISAAPVTPNTPTGAAPGIVNAKVSCAVVVTSTVHNQTVGSLTNLTLSGVTPLAYNRNVSASITGIQGFTFAQTTNLGDATIRGYVLDTDTANLSRCLESFFKQGYRFNNGQMAMASVIELGAVASIADGVGLLAEQIAAEPGRFHGYCFPSDAWTTNDVLALAVDYNDLQNLPVFFIQAPTDVALSKFRRANLYCVAGFVNGNGDNKPASEFEAAIGMFHYLSTHATEQTPRGQAQYLSLIGTPYEFTSAFDSRILEFKEGHVNYFAKESEGGRTGTMLMGGCLMAADDYGTPVDMLAKWSVSHFNFYGDKMMAGRIIDGSNNPSKRLSLNDTDGQYAINDLKSTFQGFIDSEKRAKIIEDTVFVDGKSVKTVALAQNYFDFKREHFTDWTEKHYSQLGANISVRGGISKLTININVNFS